MFEKFLYYWLLWIIFIIVAFFMDTSRKRLYLLIWLLLVIICSPYDITFNKIELSVAFLMLLIGTIIFFAIESVTWYKFFVSFTLMLCYISLLIWEKITPVWFFMPSYFLIPFLMVILILLLVRKFYDRLSVALVGVAFGQFIYELLLISYKLHDVIGDEIVFIHISLIILFITIMNFFQFIFYKLTNILKRKLT